MRTTRRTGVLAVLVPVVLMVMVSAPRAGAQPEPAHLVSMAEAAQALQQAGAVMQAHGQTMLDQGQATADQDLIAHGEHWVRDGQALVQRAQWLTMNPIAPGSLVTSPADLSAGGSWGELAQTAEAMLHDPSQARSAIDLDALRWNGEAMLAEGRTMTEHGRVMAEEAELMVAWHGLAGQDADELRQAAATMQQVGGHLQKNGQEMIDYADRLRRSMGFP